MTTRAPLLDRTRLLNALRRGLFSPWWIPTGAVALVLAGALGLASDTFYLYEAFRMSADSYVYTTESPLIGQFFMLQATLGWLLITVGLFGLHALLSGAARLPRRLALAGAALALAFAALVTWEALWFWLSPLGYSPAPTFLFYGLPTGILLSGVAAHWARGLGRWRFLPLVVCLLETPLVSELLYYLFGPDPESAMMLQTEFKTELLRASPRVATDAGLILFGFVLFGAKNRETKLLAKKRRAMEERNLALARRLYADAWVEGNVEGLGGIVAPDCEDRYGNGRGPESLERAIANLRRAFPDLRFGVEEQIADGDTVTTRWSASGTDHGGVLWYPPTGKHAAFSGTFVDRFANGRLVEHRGESDTASLLEQLGLSRKQD